MSRCRLLRTAPVARQPEGYEWSELKGRKRRISEEYVRAPPERLAPEIEPMADHLAVPVADWVRHQVEAEPYWFQKVELLPGYSSPGWDEPAVTSCRTTGSRTT